MATKTVLISDLSGEPGATTTRIGFGDDAVEVDLTPAEIEDLERGLRAYLAAGRQVDLWTARPKRPVVPETSAAERAAIRAWAREQGYEFAERGRIPKAVQAAYDEAHGIGPRA